MQTTGLLIVSICCNFLVISGVTRGGRGERVPLPLESLGEILEGRGKGGKWGGRGKKREKGKREAREKRENGEENKGNCKRGGGKLEMEGERYENERRTSPFSFFFFCLSLFDTTEICLGVPKLKFLRGKKWEMDLWLHTCLCPCLSF